MHSWYVIITSEEMQSEDNTNNLCSISLQENCVTKTSVLGMRSPITTPKVKMEIQIRFDKLAKIIEIKTVCTQHSY